MPGYRKTMGSRYRKVSMKSLPPAVQMASQGEFIVSDNVLTTGFTLTAGTTAAVQSIAGTSGSAKLLPKVESWLWMFSAATRLPVVVAVIKCEPTLHANNYDIIDEAVLARLRTEGRLFYHHWHYLPAVAATAERVPAPFHFVWKNVKLEDGENLEVAACSRVTSADVVLWPQVKRSETDL